MHTYILKKTNPRPRNRDRINGVELKPASNATMTRLIKPLKLEQKTKTKKIYKKQKNTTTMKKKNNLQ